MHGKPQKALWCVLFYLTSLTDIAHIASVLCSAVCQMGACSSKEAEFAFRKPNKLDADLDRIAAIEAERQHALDAETIRLKLNEPDGTLDVNARLSGTLREFKEEKVAPEVGWPRNLLSTWRLT